MFWGWVCCWQFLCPTLKIVMQTMNGACRSRCCITCRRSRVWLPNCKISMHTQMPFWELINFGWRKSVRSGGTLPLLQQLTPWHFCHLNGQFVSISSISGQLTSSPFIYCSFIVPWLSDTVQSTVTGNRYLLRSVKGLCVPLATILKNDNYTPVPTSIFIAVCLSNMVFWHGIFNILKIKWLMKLQ